jgi:hypothetical protein
MSIQQVSVPAVSPRQFQPSAVNTTPSAPTLLPRYVSPERETEVIDTDLDSDSRSPTRRRRHHHGGNDSHHRSYSMDVTTDRGNAERRVRQHRSFVRPGPRGRSVSPLLQFLRDNNLDYDSENEDPAAFFTLQVSLAHFVWRHGQWCV